MNELYNKALKIATEAHEGQTDKAGMTYITHPIRVAARCTLLEEKIVALLHDTLEDTYVTEDYLLSEGFPQHIVEAVKSVTRCPGESYRDFIRRSAANPIGKMVKIHDLEDNMDITRLPALTDADFLRLQKYLHSYRYLTTSDDAELQKVD